MLPEGAWKAVPDGCHNSRTLGLLNAAIARPWRAASWLTGALEASWWVGPLTLWALSSMVVIASAFVGTSIIAGQRGWGEGVHCCGLNVPDQVQAPDKLLARWDAGYYALIATGGYTAGGPERAFFPLFPMLTRLVAFGVGGDVYRAGVLISAIASLIAGLFLYKLVRDFMGDRDALFTVACFYAFPMAFYMFAPYAESLFLAAATCALWLARRGSVLRSGALVALAGMTRPTGFICLLPLAIEGLVQYRRDVRGLVRLSLGMLVGALGLLVAMILMRLTDDPSVWPSYLQVNQQYWSVRLELPWTTYAGAFGAAIFGQGLGTDWFTRGIAVIELLSGLFALGALIVLILRRSPPSLLAFTLATLVAITAGYGPDGHALDSMPRHVLSLFPVFAAVAMALRGRTARLAWLGVSEVALVVSTAWFASGRWLS